MKFNKLDQTEGSTYLKIKDGESVIGVPRGEIYSFKIKWESGKSSVINEPNPAKHNRFSMNFVVKTDQGLVCNVWEYGITVYNTLAEFASEMDLTKTKIKVTRKGTGTDTTYVLIPLGPVDPQSMPAIEAMKLNILDKKPVVENVSQETPWPNEDSLPF